MCSQADFVFVAGEKHVVDDVEFDVNRS